LMRILSLKNDTSQGDGGPPEISHSASSVVEASKVASSIIMPPSPTYNKETIMIVEHHDEFRKETSHNLRKTNEICSCLKYIL